MKSQGIITLDTQPGDLLKWEAEIPVICDAGIYTDEPPSYKVRYGDFIHTGKSYHDSEEILEEMIGNGRLPEGARFMLQSEAAYIAKRRIEEGLEPRRMPEFGAYFKIKNKLGYFPYEYTLTGVRIPSKWLGRIDKGTGKHPVKILIGKEVVDETQLPPGIGKEVITAYNKWGLPEEAREIPWPHEGYYEHWWLNPRPKKDRESGHYDLAVGRWGRWPLDERCLGVEVGYARWDAGSSDGFRPVVGIPAYSADDLRLFSCRSSPDQIGCELAKGAIIVHSASLHGGKKVKRKEPVQ